MDGNRNALSRTIVVVIVVILIWLYALTPYWVQRSYLSGVFYNPALEGFFFPTMTYSG